MQGVEMQLTRWRLLQACCWLARLDRAVQGGWIGREVARSSLPMSTDSDQRPVPFSRDHLDHAAPIGATA